MLPGACVWQLATTAWQISSSASQTKPAAAGAAVAGATHLVGGTGHAEPAHTAQAEVAGSIGRADAVRATRSAALGHTETLHTVQALVTDPAEAPAAIGAALLVQTVGSGIADLLL